jgi:hypothetical protein
MSSAPLPSKPIIIPSIQSINPTSNSNMMIMDNTAETSDQMLFNIQHIKPIQPTMIDDHELPSSTDSTYTISNAVDLNTPIFITQSYLGVQPASMEIKNSSSILLEGKSKRMSIEKFTLLLELNEQEQPNKSVVHSIDAVREVMVN